MALDINGVMQEVAKTSSPDLHLQVGQLPIIRQKNGTLVALENAPILTEQDIEDIIQKITNEEQRDLFEKNWQLDFSYHLQNVSRFRVSLFKESKGVSIAFRLIPDSIPTAEELGLSDTIKKLGHLKGGLVLVTGATGMGKSTSIASLIDYINKNRSAHVITIEDPIEFVFESDNCLFSQRELNVHTHSFANAIKGALRQDPDIVMVGEMRDLETISTAITLAETGHLVLSTLHTVDSVQTINRIIDVFPSDQQDQIRTQLSSVLKGVISQALIPRQNEEGRIAAREIMIMNPAIRNCIIKGETHQIYSIMQINSAQGMRLMDENLEELVRQGEISLDDAIVHASDPVTLYNKFKD